MEGNIVKMAILPKLAYRDSTIPIEIPVAFFFFFADMDELILKLIWKFKGPRRAETILKKKNKVGRITLPNCETHCKAVAIKIM